MPRKPTVAQIKQSILRTIERDPRAKHSKNFGMNTLDFSIGSGARGYIYQKLYHPSLHLKIGRWRLTKLTHVKGFRGEPVLVER